MRKLIKYFLKFKKEFIIGPAFKLIEAVFELIVPLLMAKIIDIGVKNEDISYIMRTGGLMLLLGVVGFCSTLVCQYMGSKASQGFGTVLRNDLYRHINTLSHAEIDKIGTSSLITRITNDINQLQVAVAMMIRLVIRAPFLIIGATVMAFTRDAGLAVIFVIVIPLIAFVLYTVMSRSVPYYHKIQKKLDKITLITSENLEGARVIRAFSKQQNENERFNEANDDFTKATVKVGKISALLNPLTYAILNFAIIAIIWFGGINVNSGILTQGEIMALVNYMTQIFLALVVVANLVVIFTKASASAERVSEIFKITPSVTDVSVNTVNKNSSEQVNVEFRNVSFSYNGNDEYALENVSVSIKKGETVGIIGGTGSGKSTFVNLIPRFYDVSSGEIFVDGINVKNYKISDLRLKIGMVPQQAAVFEGTISENMRWGNENASIDDINSALEISQSKEFVDKLPEGIETKIQQGGKNLSGGQKQRLTIARALTMNPEILILDDSSSALDFATDAALRKAINGKISGVTVFMVSQRASTIKNADKIIVFEEGKAVGIGKHSELINSCPVYREICSSQSAEEDAHERN